MPSQQVKLDVVALDLPVVVDLDLDLDLVQALPRGRLTKYERRGSDDSDRLAEDFDRVVYDLVLAWVC